MLLIWLFYFLTRRGWCAFLGSFLPCIIVAMVNYFKLRLRSDPFLAADRRRVSEAGGIVGNYAREGLMVDLSDLWETGGSDIAEGSSSVSQLDGSYYMYPLSVAAHCMAINNDVEAIQRELASLERQLHGLEKDLKDKKKKYEASVQYLYKNKSIEEKLMFIFSA